MKRLADEMAELAENMEYERAARLRDRIRALSSVTQEQSINPQGVEEADVFALHAEGGQACVQVFFFRAGQNWGNRAYFPRVAGVLEAAEAAAEDGAAVDEDAAILDAFIGQFYEGQHLPRLIR